MPSDSRHIDRLTLQVIPETDGLSPMVQERLEN